MTVLIVLAVMFIGVPMLLAYCMLMGWLGAKFFYLTERLLGWP